VMPTIMRLAGEADDIIRADQDAVVFMCRGSE
jgi:hypothetical protein